MSKPVIVAIAIGALLNLSGCKKCAKGYERTYWQSETPDVWIPMLDGTQMYVAGTREGWRTEYVCEDENK